MKKNKPLFLIVATENSFGIGFHGQMPWHFKKEMRYFREITTSADDPNKQNAILMGRTTWESIPEKFRPLKSRLNIVLSSDPTKIAHAKSFSSLEHAMEALYADESVAGIFVIGGSSLYRQLMETNLIDGIFLTRIRADFDCDSFFPDPSEKFPEKTLLGQDKERGVDIEYWYYY